jgi:excisionase family DNA binding protein
MNDRTPDNQKWLNVTQAAKYAGIGRTTLNDWIREGRIPFTFYRQAGRVKKFKTADIDAWLESIKEGPGTGPVYPRKRK